MVVGHGVVVEPAQRLIRPGRRLSPGLRANSEGPPQPPADHRERAPAVRQQYPEPRIAFQHPGHGDVRRGDRRLQRVTDRVPQVVAVEGGQAEATGGRVDEDQGPGRLGCLPERQEELVPEVTPGHAGRDLRSADARDRHELGDVTRGQGGILYRHGADRAHLPGAGRGELGQRLVLHLAHGAGLVNGRVDRDQVDPRGQQQVLDAGRDGLREHGGSIGELAHDRAQLPATEAHHLAAVLAGDGGPPAGRHRTGHHLRRDDVTVRVNDQCGVPNAVPFAAGLFAAGPEPAPVVTAPPR